MKQRSNISEWLKVIIIFFIIIYSSSAQAQRGKNGALTVTAPGTIINEFTNLTANANTGAVSINVINSGLNINGRFPALLAPYDLVMIIQMQGATIKGNVQDNSWGEIVNYNNCGWYEFAEVLSVPNANTINITCPLKNNYTANGKVQVIRVPRLTALTINAGGILTTLDWNGTTGGVLAVEVLNNTQINFGGSIEATGKGFRGGELDDDTDMSKVEFVSQSSFNGGEKGESIAGFQADYDIYGGRYCRGAAANGGGGGNAHNAGGGGGANSGVLGAWNGDGNPDKSDPAWIQAWNLEFNGFANSASSGGGRGGYSFSMNENDAFTVKPGDPAWSGDARRNVGGKGGRPLDYSAGRLFLGGGGGSGDNNNGYGGGGGSGGGLIYILSYGTIGGTGKIITNGNPGFDSNDWDAPGGAGAGGTIVLNSTGAINGITAIANGGKGGDPILNFKDAYGPGGGGGGGYIAISNGNIIRQALGGKNGITTSPSLAEFIPNGATIGGNGLLGTINLSTTFSAQGDTICAGASAVLTAATNMGAVSWYTAAIGGNLLGTGSPFTTPPLFTDTVFYASICSAPYRIPVTVKVNPLPIITVTSPVICKDSIGTITASGAVSYIWSTGAITNSINVTATSLTPPTYTVTGTNANGCSNATTATITVKYCSAPSVTVTGKSICPNTCANLTAVGTGGAAPLSFTWNPNIGSGSGPHSVCPTATTVYSVTVTDANGLTATDTAIVVVYPLPTVTSTSATICAGNSATITASGGINYTWSSGETTASITKNPIATTTYTVTGTNANGCSNTTTAAIIVNSNLLVSVPAATICPGSSTTLTASGADTYTWTPATGLNSTAGTSVTASPANTTTYTVTGTNFSGCTGTVEVIVTVDPPITLNVAGIDVTCFAACNGQTIVIPTGGSGAFSYSWSNGCTAAACNTICAGTYSVIATDGAGCTASGLATVNQPPALTIALTSLTDVSCFGVCDGTAGISAGGGTGAYTYSWTPNGGNTANANGLCAGTYTCTVTDANNCSANFSVIITQPTKVVVSSGNATICPNTAATLNATGLGGTGTITYNWNPGSLTGSTVTVSPASTTTYTITGTDTNGCTGFTTLIVTLEPTPIITAPAATICEGASTTLTASGASTYSWTPTTFLNNPAIANPIATPTVTTTYTVTGTSSAGCTGLTTVVVTVNLKPIITGTGGNACPGKPIPLSVSGANLYLWSPSTGLNTNSASNVIATPAVTTAYTITATGVNGCTSSITVIATVNPNPVAAFATTPEIVDEFNPTIYFTDQSTGAATWNWNFGDPTNSTSSFQNPSFTYPLTPATYLVHLIVTNQFGCIDSTSNTVRIRGIFTFFIPNTFTPNGDGTNDEFLAKGVGIDETDYDLWIFDRWGNLIWHTEIWGEAWDGKASNGSDIAQIDTYVWKVHVREKENMAKHNYIGHVNIVR